MALTVGYGDFYPTTMPGRLVALGLMIGGIGLIGYVTGSLATWIVEGRHRHSATRDHRTARRDRGVTSRPGQAREQSAVSAR
jgi:voltage-gated potassium channel